MSSLPIAQKFLDACKEYRVKLDQLERENAALRKENEALHKTLSAAIDAARAKEDKP